MNQFYRALHMPPKRLLRKVMGEKEIYTIAVRPRPTAEGTEPLPALEGGPYTLLPRREGWWFADPLLYHRRGKRWLFAEVMDLSTGKGRLEVCELHDDGTADDWRVALEEDFHLSLPRGFDWNGEVWMIPETGSDHSLRLYRCKTFPTQWELVQRFPTDEELCDTILLDRRAEALTLLCSETRPANQLYVRYRRYTLRHAVQETAAVPLPAEDTLPAAPGPFELLPDEAYNLQHRDFDLVSRNAGPFFLLGEQIIHPTQVSTTVDYGVYLQFLARRGSSEVPLCAATPQNVEITGLAETPTPGDEFDAVADERMARELVEERKQQKKDAANAGSKKVSLDDLFSRIQQGEMKDFNIIVKADVQGSAEAVKSSLEKLSNDEVRVQVIHSGVGAINESDVMLAATSNAIIVGFNVRPDAAARDNAARSNVEIRMYRVIYDCINEIEAAMKGMLAPKFQEQIIGHVEIRQTFKVSKVGTVCGGYVTDGKIVRNSKVRVVRDNIVVFEGDLASLRRFKDDVKEVAAGYECGLQVDKYNDVKVGDVIEVYVMEEIKN